MTDHVKEDLDTVGPNKPMGYLPLDTIRHCGHKPDRLLEHFRKIGLEAHIFRLEECHVASGALYVWDYIALGKLLQEHSDVLAQSGWPSDPNGFAFNVVEKSVSEDRNPALYWLIAKAFGDTSIPAGADIYTSSEEYTGSNGG